MKYESPITLHPKFVAKVKFLQTDRPTKGPHHSPDSPWSFCSAAMISSIFIPMKNSKGANITEHKFTKHGDASTLIMILLSREKVKVP